MKYSYNWLKWYIPDAPIKEKLADIVTYHLFEVEGVEEKPDGDSVFDIKILPNRGHDLLSHQGMARELASLLDIKYNDPTPKYKIPEVSSRLDIGNSKGPTFSRLQIEVKSEKCRRYMGRILRNVKVGPSPEWVKMHLESIGQRSINNIVDAANLVMYDCGQPIHCFDLDKISEMLLVRNAIDGEGITTLDNKQVKLNNSNLVITDTKNVLAIAGVKGGKIAEVDENTKNIIIEVANFDPVSVRKTARGINIFTDAAKRFENDLSPELCSFAMLEISGLFLEFGFTDFEEVVDFYPKKQEVRKLTFSAEKISKILGISVSTSEIENILKRYNFSAQGGPASGWEITVPPMRLDLAIEEDMAEEIGRILGYEKVIPNIPKINFTIKQNEIYTKILWAREKLLSDGYNEVMTYSFVNKGEVEVLESASDKKFMRTNLSDGLKESAILNKLNLPFLGLKESKIFEIGTIFKSTGEEIHVAYGDKKEVEEITLDAFVSSFPVKNLKGDFHSQTNEQKFQMWSLFPFIARDIAVFVPKEVESSQVLKVIKDNMNELVVKEPELFDEFKKDDKISYGFRLVFQSYDRTLTDAEVNTVMDKITNKIKDQKTNGQDWQVR